MCGRNQTNNCMIAELVWSKSIRNKTSDCKNFNTRDKNNESRYEWYAIHVLEFSLIYGINGM